MSELTSWDKEVLNNVEVKKQPEFHIDLEFFDPYGGRELDANAYLIFDLRMRSPFYKESITDDSFVDKLCSKLKSILRVPIDSVRRNESLIFVGIPDSNRPSISPFPRGRIFMPITYRQKNRLEELGLKQPSNQDEITKFRRHFRYSKEYTYLGSRLNNKLRNLNFIEGTNKMVLFFNKFHRKGATTGLSDVIERTIKTEGGGEWGILSERPSSTSLNDICSYVNYHLSPNVFLSDKRDKIEEIRKDIKKAEDEYYEYRIIGFLFSLFTGDKAENHKKRIHSLKTELSELEAIPPIEERNYFIKE